ncbi:MAG: TROVE domain-containing protein [Chitinophagales bacterium]|nr:TROVE domain-containing protein [Bacteroidota bacterium]MCB9043226.1 TROVE domain-containing protein [Chitinophagales bacterium]
MSRFNQKLTFEKTINLAGGEAYMQSPEVELLSVLLTSFANDQYYRNANDTFERLKELIRICDKKFVAQAAIYARTQFGMRSITHVVTSELAKHLSGMDWAKNFYDKIVYRPDDMMEILSYHAANNGKIPNAMKKGFAQAFDRFDAYALAKYRGENKGFKLVDVVNLVHPIPTERNAEALRELMEGKLRSSGTWESELTRAGQAANNEDEREAFKKEVWVNLVREKKIGYFALLRNLRNIIEQAPEVIDEAMELLTNENLIKKSLVLPFRYITAYDEVQKLTADGKIVRKVMNTLNKAVDIAVNNVPVFAGDTLVVLDVSGSMSGKPATIGALFSAILVKSNNADLMTFDNTARYVNVNTADSTLTIANAIRFSGGGTNFQDIFKRANRKYARVIILSDMQGWIGYNTPTKEFNEWKKTTGANPYVYSYDLQGYGTMQFPEANVFCIAGFSEKIFDVMKLLETDKNALVNTIKSVEI